MKQGFFSFSGPKSLDMDFIFIVGTYHINLGILLEQRVLCPGRGQTLFPRKVIVPRSCPMVPAAGTGLIEELRFPVDRSEEKMSGVRLRGFRIDK